MRLIILAFGLLGAAASPAAADPGTLTYQVDTRAVTRALYRVSVEPVREIVGAGPEIAAADDGIVVRPAPDDAARVDAALAAATAETFGFDPADVATMQAAGVWERVARRMAELGVPSTTGYSYERRADGFVVRAQNLFVDPTLANWAQTYLRRRAERVVGLNTVEPAPEAGRYLVRSDLDVDGLRAALDRHTELTINHVVREPGEGVVSLPADGTAFGLDAAPLLVRSDPVVTGADLLLAEPSVDPYGGNAYALLVLTDAGAEKLGEATAGSVGMPLAIVLDGVVISAPVVNEPVRHGVVQIAGGFSPQAMEDLAVRLQSAAAPGALRRVD